MPKHIFGMMALEGYIALNKLHKLLEGAIQ